jgi:hypothetical protein
MLLSQFSAIFNHFWQKIGVFSDNFLQKLSVCNLRKNTNFFAKFLGENILKITTSGPGMICLLWCNSKSCYKVIVQKLPNTFASLP